MLCVTVPEYRILPAPAAAVPTEKWVAVPPAPAVIAPKVMAAAGLTLLPVTVQPPAVRATAMRAYPVYRAL